MAPAPPRPSRSPWRPPSTALNNDKGHLFQRVESSDSLARGSISAHSSTTDLSLCRASNNAGSWMSLRIYTSEIQADENEELGDVADMPAMDVERALNIHLAQLSEMLPTWSKEANLTDKTPVTPHFSWTETPPDPVAKDAGPMAASLAGPAPGDGLSPAKRSDNVNYDGAPLVEEMSHLPESSIRASKMAREAIARAMKEVQDRRSGHASRPSSKRRSQISSQRSAFERPESPPTTPPRLPSKDGTAARTRRRSRLAFVPASHSSEDVVEGAGSKRASQSSTLSTRIQKRASRLPLLLSTIGSLSDTDFSHKQPNTAPPPSFPSKRRKSSFGRRSRQNYCRAGFFASALRTWDVAEEQPSAQRDRVPAKLQSPTHKVGIRSKLVADAPATHTRADRFSKEIELGPAHLTSLATGSASFKVTILGKQVEDSRPWRNDYSQRSFLSLADSPAAFIQPAKAQGQNAKSSAASHEIHSASSTEGGGAVPPNSAASEQAIDLTHALGPRGVKPPSSSITASHHPPPQRQTNGSSSRSTMSKAYAAAVSGRISSPCALAECPSLSFRPRRATHRELTIDTARATSRKRLAPVMQEPRAALPPLPAGEGDSADMSTPLIVRHQGATRSMTAQLDNGALIPTYASVDAEMSFLPNLSSGRSYKRRIWRFLRMR